MSAVRLLWLALAAFVGPSGALAQGLAWEYAEPAPVSAGARATLFGFPFPQAFEQPGFSPSAVVAREDGAYLILPVNGGSGSGEPRFVLNPSWERLRGFQILRLDASGQVLWKRFWNLGGIANGFSPVLPVAIDDARLTPGGGLALLANARVLHLDADAGAQTLDALLLPAECSPAGEFPSIERARLTAEGDLLVALRGTQTLPARACALDASGSVLDAIDAPVGRSMDVQDFRRGVGFLIRTREGTDPTSPWQDTRLRQAAGDRWLIPASLDTAEGFGLSAAGDAWLRDGAGALRVVGVDGGVRAELTGLPELAVQAWLTGGDALLGDSGASDLRRLSPEGVQRWRMTRASTSLALGDWQVLGERARLLAARNSGDGEVLSLDLGAGALQVSPGFALGGLAAGPLGLMRHLSAGSGEPESLWQRDPSTCLDAACAPRGVSFASTIDMRVFASVDGAPLAGPAADGFGFPTYARLRERTPAVAREVNTLEVAHARYLSNGEKEILEVTRLSERGQVLWRRQLQFPRFDAADAVVEVVDGIVHVAASARGPLASEHRLWALDAQGQVLWERELDEPFKQLARVNSDIGRVLCGLGYTQRGGGPWQVPLWRCFDATGNLRVDSRLTQVPPLADALISHVAGMNVVLRLLDPASQSATGVSLRSISAEGLSTPGSVSWDLQPLGSAEFVRIDAVTRRAINLVTAPVYASASAFRPDGLLVAAFDSSGARLWQQRISQPLRPSVSGQTYTAVDTDGQGVVHVAFPPNVGTNVFPLRVCRLAAADGALLGCADAPLEGRPGALFVLSEPQGVWMWANQTLADGQTELTLYPLRADGIAAPSHRQTGLQVRQSGSEIGRFDRSWVVAEPADVGGVRAEAPPGTRVLLFQPGQLFRDGFEAAPTR